ncbi:MAG: RNA polymerase sigma factor [Anaerolineae bacterium]
MMVINDDRSLIDQARRGNVVAFEALIERYTPALFRVVRRMITDTSEAEAIVQETFFRLWNHLERYQGERPLLPYLVTIAANLARDQWRRDQHFDPDGDDTLDELMSADEMDPLERLEEQDALLALVRAVEKLPAHYRTVIALRYDAALSYEEIAAAMKIPLNTVRTYLYRAKTILRQLLLEEDYALLG